MTVYEPGSVDDVARYQAKKLAKEGDAAFARACGEFARNDAFRSLNETIIANVGRDRDKGAMFALVPTGTETCTFCLMLASRGAVYHTRKTAGEWRHFHRGCDCKVEPSFEGDSDAEVVQGVKPRELYERYKQFKEIDEAEGLSSAEKDELKRRILDGCKASERSVIRMLKSGEIEDASDVHVPTSSEVPNWLSGASRNRHAKRHAAEYGIDCRSRDGREKYNRIMSEVIDAADSVVLFDGIGGRNGQVCAVYFRGIDIAVVYIERISESRCLSTRREGVTAVEHFGIRYENDLTDKFSEYLVDSVDLLNAQLEHRDLAFFFDTVDVCQQVIGGMHCEDMFGWVVPNDAVKDFEPIWLAGNDRNLEGYDYVCASWEDRGGFPHAIIDGELPEEAYE